MSTRTQVRRQARQVILAGAIAGGSLAIPAAAVLALAGQTAPPALWLAVTGLVAGLAAAGFAGARRRSARLVAGAAALAALALMLLVGTGVMLLVLGRLPDPAEHPLVLPAVAGALVATAGYPPARARARRAAALVSHGRRRTPDEVLRTFGDRASRGVPLEELLRQLGESLRTTMDLRSVELWSGDGETLERTLAIPQREVDIISGADVQALRRTDVAGEAWCRTWAPHLLAARPATAQVRLAPAHHAGVVLGLIVVDRPADGERFTPADERTLGEIARNLAVVLHNRRLDSALQTTLDDLRRTNEELRASRTRLVATADAERRRIERDIHDGAQQHLVALAVNLGLARDLLADDPAASKDLLDELAVDLRDTIAQVRDLAHGVYPPLLREAGLDAALRAAATRSPQSVSVQTVDVPRLPAEVEAAIYFCCLEALQNASKHAPDADVHVTVRSADRLSFEIADDGPGFDVDATPPGHGLQNMADRLGAIGGTVTWQSAPGQGTVVRGDVPLSAET